MSDADYSWASRDDWPEAWRNAAQAVGRDFGSRVDAADAIERGAVRRYLEPLEFDCPLHYDEAVAAEHGYRGIVAPYSGLATWTSAGVWVPGDEPIYLDPDRNAQPKPRIIPFPHVGPSFNAGFATDIEYEFFEPCVVGDKLHVRGPTLLAVNPKETSVGRGAFLTWQSDVHDQRDVKIASMRFGMYRYVTCATYAATRAMERDDA